VSRAILEKDKTMASGPICFGKSHNKCADEERKKGDLKVDFIPAPSERM